MFTADDPGDRASQSALQGGWEVPFPASFPAEHPPMRGGGLLSCWVVEWGVLNQI